MPGMCLVVVEVAVMSVVGWWSALAKVEEAATAAAEEATMGRGWAGAKSVFMLPSPIFLLKVATLWSSIFLMRQAFSKHLPH
jgi:hypothetical protein